MCAEATPLHAAMAGESGNRRGIQSLDIGLSILEVFAVADGPLTLTQLADRLSMPASKLHRYVSSFCAAGFLIQKHRSGAYDLGPRAMSVGLAALTRNDFVSRAADALEDLVDGFGCTATLNVWGNQGPTVVRWERGRDGLTTALGLGSVLPLLESATGQVFLSYLPERFVSSVLEERGMAREGEIDSLIKRVRRQGYASVDGRFIPGLNAVAAPILNWQGTIELSVTIVSHDPAVLDPAGQGVARLAALARSVSVLDPVSSGDAGRAAEADDGGS